MMSINPTILILSIINFIILYFILKKFFFKKIEAIIDERQDLINSKLDEAEEEVTRARILAVENERIAKNARDEGKLITKKQKEKADKIYNEIIEEAHEESKIILDRARLEIEREKKKAQSQLKNEVVGLAMNLSEKIIAKNIDEEKNRDLINDFISKVGKS